MAASQVQVDSWNGLLEALYEDSWDEEIGRYRAKVAMRGLSDARYSLETTLMRLGGDYSTLERHLLRNFRKYAHRSVVERDSPWHWLSVARHYDLPTRLLDWTNSPFVAMHFATANLEKFDTDGVIWMIDYIEAHKLLPSKVRSLLDAEGANIFTVDMLSRAHKTDPEKHLSPLELHTLSDEPFVLFFEPSSIDDRIVNQYAFFSFQSDPQQPLDAWLAAHPQLWRKIVIPAGLKWEIRDKLDQANINERVLFPGLTGLSRWLTRYYSPKDPPT